MRRYRAARARQRTILSNGPATKLDPLLRWAEAMSLFSSFLLGLVAGAMLIYAVMSFHVVRARDGFHVVNKQPPRMGETYVDIRSFGMSDWAGRPQLTSAL